MNTENLKLWKIEVPLKERLSYPQVVGLLLILLAAAVVLVAAIYFVKGFAIGCGGITIAHRLLKKIRPG